MYINKFLKEDLDAGSLKLLEPYLNGLISSIIDTFDSYGIEAKLDNTEAIGFNRSWSDKHTFIEVYLHFYLIFNPDSEVNKNDEKVLENFTKDEVLNFISSHDYPIPGRSIANINHINCTYYEADPVWGYEQDKWEFYINVTESSKSEKSLGNTIEEVAKNLGRAKSVTEGTLIVIKYPNEVVDELKIPAQYEFKNMTYTGNFKYWDQFKPVTIDDLPNYKYWRSANSPEYAAINMAGIYKRNPDIVLVWRYHDKNKVAYLMNKKEYDTTLKTLEDYYNDLLIKNKG